MIKIFKNKRLAFLLVLLLVFVFTLVGCQTKISEKKQQKETSIPAANAETASKLSEFELLRQAADKYLKQNKEVLITAEELYKKVILDRDQSYYIVDIRGNSHFAAAYIPGAVNIPYAETWKPLKTDLLPNDKKIVLVCYSGHTSSQTAAFWNMLGLDVYVLKNGMASWSKSQAIIGSTPLACEPFHFPVVTDVPTTKTYELPTINEGLSDLTSLLHKRAEKYLSANYKPVILAKDLNEKIEDFFLLDIRDRSDYKKGHIAGSINIPYEKIAKIDNLKKLPADKKIVVIGYNGHAASEIVRTISLLGYNATALKDGMRIWTGNEAVIGTKAINCQAVQEYPTEQLNYQPKTDSGPATCSG